MNVKQKTLFESWNKSSQSASTSNDDKAVLTSLKTHNLITTCFSPDNQNAFQTPSTSKRDPLLDSFGFDADAGKTWIYPTNYPVRDYQFSIVQEALFKNTLVILPTGLGKTFIAAVVMFNIYRWYPKGKVIFMAPTRPLVAQQIDACFKITGISKEDTTQMTGATQPEERKRLWLRKRVFFLTPQVLCNDIARNICPAANIKCIVIDEAHKSLGNHAYCQVIQEVQAFTSQFRVLALTATPGGDIQAVKLVLSNLLISHVELRTEDSEDVKQYTHIRDIEKIVIPLGDQLNEVKSRFLDIINIYLKRLTQRGVISSRNPTSLTKFQILKMREDFAQHPPSSIDKFTFGLSMADFSLLISLYHAYELLLLHGARQFYNFLTGILNGEKSIPHARAELQKNEEFERLMSDVQENYIPDPVPDGNISVFKRTLPGHPKLKKLLEVVLNHFRTIDDKNTRVMIFSQYRDSVHEIVDMLNLHQPMVKCMSFIGQASKSATSAGISQKQQLKVLEQFRSGGYNTLVSTCVGEEGLDIGEVDLIVCYDCPKSPIRLVQRMGRTGRLRKGRIVILIGEGKEEKMLSSCEGKKKSVQKAIMKGFTFGQMFYKSPSLITSDRKPTCVKMVITPPDIKKEESRGKSAVGAYLSKEELAEYNLFYKITKSNSCLLPKSKFLCLKTNDDEQEREPIFSLSKWSLWQTRPQRIHNVTHSSKTLLFSTTIEEINFPTHSKMETDQEIDGSSRCGIGSPVFVDLCDDDNFFDPVVPVSSPPENINFQVEGELNQLENNRQSRNLLSRLFGITSASPPPTKTAILNIEKPPNIKDLQLSAGNISLDFKPLAERERKMISTLHILNKKMKAQLKKKTKELDLKFSISVIKENFNESLFFMTRPDVESTKNSLQVDGNKFPFTNHNPPIASFNIFFSPSPPHNFSMKDFNNTSPLLAQKLTFSPNNFSSSPLLDEDFTVPLIEAKHYVSPAMKQTSALRILAPFEKQTSPLKQTNNFETAFEKHISPLKVLSSPEKLTSPLKKVSFQPPAEKLTSSLKEINNYLPLAERITSPLKETHSFQPPAEKHTSPLKEGYPAERHTFSVKHSTDSPEALKFDVSFDMFQNNSFFKDDFENLNEVAMNNTPAKTEINKDVSVILDQLSSNHKLPSNSFESSLTQPLTVKKVVLEKEYKKDCKIDSLSSVSRTDFKNQMKNTKSLNTNNHKNSTKCNADKSISPVAETVSQTGIRNKSTLQSVVEKRNNSETTEYSLTQMLSFIDSTEKFESLKNNSNNKPMGENIIEVNLFESSDEEIEPTPPKESASRFLYRNNSLNEDSNSMQVCDSKEEMDDCNKAFCEKLSFDLSDIKFSSFDERGSADISTEKTTHETVLSPDCIDKLFFDISFDQADEETGMHHSVEDLNKLKPGDDIVQVLPLSHKLEEGKIFLKKEVDFAQSTELVSNQDPFKKLFKTVNEKCSIADSHFPPSDNNKSNNKINKHELIEFSQHLSSCDTRVATKASLRFSLSKTSNVTSKQTEHCKLSTEKFSISSNNTKCNLTFLSSNNGELYLKTNEATNLIKPNNFSESLSSCGGELVPKTLFEPSTFSKQNNFTFKKPPSCKLTSEKYLLTIDNKKMDLNLHPSNHEKFEDIIDEPKSIKRSDSLTFFDSRTAASTSSRKDNFTFKQPTGYKLSKRKQNQNFQVQSKHSVNTAPKVSRSAQKKTIQVTLPKSSQNEFEDFDFKKLKQSASFLSESALKRQHSASEDSSPEKIKSSAIKKRKVKKKYNLILSQADVSGSDSSDGNDEENFEEECMEESFIDDASVRENSPNQRAMYLQSIKNCAGLPQRFKLKMDVDVPISSHLEQSDYMFDSFCVGDEDVQFCSSEEEKVETKKVGKKRKRILTMDDSSSSDDDFVRKISGDKSVFEQIEKPIGKKSNFVLSSDEEIVMENRLIEKSKKVPSNEKFYSITLGEDSSDEDDDFVTKISSNNNSFLNQKCRKSEESISSFCSDKLNVMENRIDDLVGKDKDTFNNANKMVTPIKNSNNSDTVKVDQQETEVENNFNFSFDVNWNDDFLDAFQSEQKQNVESSFKGASRVEPSTSSCYNSVSRFKMQNSVSDETCNLSAYTSGMHGHAKSVDKASDSALCEKVNFPDRPMILVDSKELAGGKPIISLLRNKYGVNPVVMQLTSADYVISNRLAVERILDTEFSASNMPVKVTDKVKLMCDAFEKSFVIIQTDCRKRVSSFNKLSSKYLQFSLHVNLHPSARVLFSCSFEESASLLSDIILKEQRNGFLIDVPVVLNPSTQLLFDFYHSCPHVTPICALRFAYHFPVVGMFLNNSVESLKKAGSISTRKAISILEYFKSEILFDAYS
ncbi:Fanconi anemia group M protein homolog isoform X1 [Parasteatoda tepidariorum]|nr:Fanconi anemia group M protein [Parasteatoda tepidariorum]XP_015904385.2 Fanconi anemia group M protein [Parasteatoda tepidariorum]